MCGPLLFEKSRSLAPCPPRYPGPFSSFLKIQVFWSPWNSGAQIQSSHSGVLAPLSQGPRVRPRAGPGNRLCQQTAPCHSRFLFTSLLAPGDGSLVVLS